MYWWIFAAVSAALVMLWFIWVAANRLDRLHRKVTASRQVLDTRLVRRASAALELATSGDLDPASAVLVSQAAYQVLDTAVADVVTDGMASSIDLAGLDHERTLAESELSATIRWVFADSEAICEMELSEVGDQLLASLKETWHRAHLARRFHNGLVGQAVRLRQQWYVRLLKLAGHAPLPEPVDLDDAWPPGWDRTR